LRKKLSTCYCSRRHLST